MNWLAQPSTWRGIFMLIGVFGWHLKPELQDAIVTAMVSAMALIEVIRDEYAPTPITVQMPPIDLIGRAGMDDAARNDAVHRAAPADRMPKPALPSGNPVESASGFNDR
jgi:hypothetical protein